MFLNTFEQIETLSNYVLVFVYSWSLSFSGLNLDEFRSRKSTDEYNYCSLSVSSLCTIRDVLSGKILLVCRTSISKSKLVLIERNLSWFYRHHSHKIHMMYFLNIFCMLIEYELFDKTTCNRACLVLRGFKCVA